MLELRARRATILILAVTVAAVSGAACASNGARPRPFPQPPPPAGASRSEESNVATSIAAAVIETALGLRGTPYRNGGADPKGFDCSGFTQFVFGRHSIQLSREVRDQYAEGTRIAVPERGDLVFFATTSKRASHVGIALGNGEFIHAPSSRGVVRVERLTQPYWADRFLGVRRIVAER